MQENYYDELLREIEETLAKDPKKAERLIRNELEMPYIPQDVERRLKEMLKARAFEDKTELRPLSYEEIAAGLRGEAALQFQAVEALSHLNCRDWTEEIQRFFDSHPHPTLQALMIDTLIDQQLMEEFTVEMDGISVQFLPRYVEKPQDTDGYILAERDLTEWLESDDPSFLALCRQLLIQEAFLMLPFAYEEEEGELLALSIVHEVSLRMDEGQTFERINRDLGHNPSALFQLKSNIN